MSRASVLSVRSPFQSYPRPNDLARHARLGNVHETFLPNRLDPGAHLVSNKLDSLLAGQTVARDDCRGVNLVFDEIVGPLEQFGGDDDDRGSAVADFLVLLLSKLDKNASSGVFDLEQPQDGCAVV